MTYIVGPALVVLVGAFIWIGCGIWRELSETKDHINRLANCLAFPRAQDVQVHLSQDTEDLLREVRWHRVKKETV